MCTVMQKTLCERLLCLFSSVSAVLHAHRRMFLASYKICSAPGVT